MSSFLRSLSSRTRTPRFGQHAAGGPLGKLRRGPEITVKLVVVRRALALLVLFALAACSRDGSPPLLDSRTPPALGPRFFPPDGWSWGVLALPDAPRIRYGAAAPAGPPRAQVVILPAYGESAEVYYETVRDLTARGYSVWVLDAAGQGGSARFPGPTDLGRSNGFGVDAAALKGLVAQVVRPGARAPLVVAASGSSALSALLAAEHGPAPIDGLFLWDPALAPAAAADRARTMTRWRLGALRADGGRAWTRPTQDLRGRSTLPAAWQLADPDLRMGGPAWEWIVAADQARREALDVRALAALRVPVAVEAAPPAGLATKLCARVAHCRVETAAAGALPRQLAPDPVRNAWLSTLTGFVEARVAERAHRM
jgi:lysophospholipase